MVENTNVASEIKAATVGSSVATLQSTDDSSESKSTLKSINATLESDSMTLGFATLESAMNLQSTTATLGYDNVPSMSVDATLESNRTLSSNSVSLGFIDAILESVDATLGTFDATLVSNQATLESNTTLSSNISTSGSNDAHLESIDASLGSFDSTLRSYMNLSSNAATLESVDVAVSLNNAALGADSKILGSVDAIPQSRSATVIPAGACETLEASSVQVSVIVPVYNAADWLDECLQAVSEQDFRGTLEISVFDDGSTDNSKEIAKTWKAKLRMRNISMVISGYNTDKPRGVGFAKNKAVAQSSGQYLCFQDADDVMMPQRVRLQYEAAVLHPNTIVGCQVRRIPEGSTERYTRWINTLSPEQLLTQVYTSHGPTVVMPTWFCSRRWFQEVGPFVEGGKGVPEDLLWFYQSLRRGGGAIRVDECLLIYRYHEHAATHSVLEETIWKHRVNFLEERVLRWWDSFTIWNAGKQGRKLYRSLTFTNQKKVKAFCDVDKNKIKKGVYTYEESKERPKPRIPVLHYRDAAPPFIVCVKLDMTGGVLEEILLSLGVTEGFDYYHFN